jgi:hypothetical protein
MSVHDPKRTPQCTLRSGKNIIGPRPPILVGCAGPGQLLFESPMVVEYLDGNYQRLASCTYEQLNRQHDQLLMTDLRERRTVRIALNVH